MITYLRVPKTGSTVLAGTLSGNNITYCGGHVLPARLAGCDHTHEYVTMIREPMQTRASLYYAYLREPAMFANIPGNDRDRPLVSSGASLEQFLAASHDETYGKFFESLDIASFTFVGQAEQMARSFLLLHAVLNIRLVGPLQANVNPNKMVAVPYTTNYDRKQFERDNPKDYIAYRAGLARFSALCDQYGV
jgi:hypothetical protein